MYPLLHPLFKLKLKLHKIEKKNNFFHKANSNSQHDQISGELGDGYGTIDDLSAASSKNEESVIHN